MDDPQKPSPLNYAPPVPKRSRIVRRVLLAGLLGFAIFAAIKWTPVARERLEILSLERQIRNYQPTLPLTIDLTKPSDDPATRLNAKFQHRSPGTTLYLGALRFGDEERLYRIYAASDMFGQFGNVALVSFSPVAPGKGYQYMNEQAASVSWPDRVRVVAVDRPDDRTVQLQIAAENDNRMLAKVRLVWTDVGRLVLEVEHAPER